jgi:PUA-domain protein
MPKLKVKKRHAMKKSKAAEVREQLASEIGESASLFSSEKVEMAETDGDVTFILVEKKPLLMEIEGHIFPTLRGAIARPFPERRVVVDSGAVRFMANGADVMRPGIVSVTDDVVADSPVVIVEEQYGKPLAIGIALYDAAEIRHLEKGKAVRNIHYVGDDIWNFEL